MIARHTRSAVLVCIALAGCSPSTPTEVVDPGSGPPAAQLPPASATTIEPPSPPATPAAPTVAPPASDAAMAGAAGLSVLVPAEVGDGGAGDPLDALARAIANEVKQSGKRKPASPTVVYLDTTIDYGCQCPPFVFAPFANSGRNDTYVLPIYVDGVPEPALVKQGVYRFAGHFDGRRITGFEWLKRRGGQRAEGMDEYARKAPVFVVEGWCFEPKAAFDHAGAEEIYRGPLTEMADAGRFCPGAAFPSPAPPETD